MSSAWAMSSSVERKEATRDVGTSDINPTWNDQLWKFSTWLKIRVLRIYFRPCLQTGGKCLKVGMHHELRHQEWQKVYFEVLASSYQWVIW